jgi:hypothetical protein
VNPVFPFIIEINKILEKIKNGMFPFSGN